MIHTHLPEIERVSPQVAEFDSTLRIELRGRNLTAECTARVSGREARIHAATGNRMLIGLPDDLSAGPQTVGVARSVEIGSSPTRHQIYESAKASFVLLPVVRKLDVVSSYVVASLAPKVGEAERTALLLNPVEGAADASYNLEGTLDEDGQVVRFPTTGVKAGRYLARVSVDNATTRLKVDEDPRSPTHGQYIAPTVVIR